MAQVTSGIRSILSTPWVYDLSQELLGASGSRRKVCAQHLRVQPGQRVVDVGCGTAELLRFLPPDIRYHGFDLDAGYIDAARERHGDRGTFTCADVTQVPPDAIPPCDVAVAFGVLHHLDDDGARALLDHLLDRLVPGGRIVTIDPAWQEGQSPIARALIARDRGQNVRDGESYRALFPARAAERKLVVRHDLLRIPYTHAIVECART
jgi:SAM-dependent methyltransferase